MQTLYEKLINIIYIFIDKYYITPINRRAITLIKEECKNIKDIINIKSGKKTSLKNIIQEYPNVKLIEIDYSKEFRNKKKLQVDVKRISNKMTYNELYISKEKSDMITCLASFANYKSKEEAINNFSNSLTENGVLIIGYLENKNFFNQLLMKFIILTIKENIFCTTNYIKNIVKDKFYIEEHINIKGFLIKPNITILKLRKVDNTSLHLK